MDGLSDSRTGGFIAERIQDIEVEGTAMGEKTLARVNACYIRGSVMIHAISGTLSSYKLMCMACLDYIRSLIVRSLVVFALFRH